MRTAILALALFAGAAASAESTPAPSLGEPYWLKEHSFEPCREYWTGELSVDDLGKSLPQVLSAIEKAGARLSRPAEAFASSRVDRSQQLSMTVPVAASRALLKALRARGRMRDPAIRPASRPAPLAELREKIDTLMKEKTERGGMLARVPASASAAEEILERLLLVEAAAKRADSEIILNLTVREGK